MKKISLILFLAFGVLAFKNANEEKYFTRTGFISFFSHTDVEDIKAENNSVISALVPSTGQIQFSVPMKSFKFPKALMEEHFNEKYVESDKYPNATFKGSVSNVSEINFAKDGEYKATIKGNLTMKDVTKEVTTNGTFKVAAGKIIGNATFKIRPEDYHIEIPKLVRNKIAEFVDVTVKMEYQKAGK